MPPPTPLDPETRAAYEAQATACLLAAEHRRCELLAVARKLTGCPEEGMDLFQQAVLDCHDAIQRRGFRGERYEFYLLTTLKHLHYKRRQAAGRTVHVDFQALDTNADADSGDEAPRLGLTLAQLHAATGQAAAAPLSAEAVLAEQVAAEVRERYAPADRLLLRLHADGYSCQQIIELTGLALDRRRVHERIQRLKAQLRRTFSQAWQALGEAAWCLL